MLIMLKNLMLKCKSTESNSLEYLSKKICGDDYLIKKNSGIHEVIQIIQNDLKDSLTRTANQGYFGLTKFNKKALQMISTPMITIDKCIVKKQRKLLKRINKQKNMVKI